MAESLVGMIRQIAQETNGGIMACTVVKTSPLLLKVQGDTETNLCKECLIIPKHVPVARLKKGETVYVMQNNSNTYFVLGKE